jgi:hypothetical protein
MTLDTIQIGAIGVKIIVTVEEGGVAKNIATAIGLKLRLRSAVASTYKEFTAAFETDGSDGQVTYTTLAATDIDAESVWSAQVYYELGAFKGFTEPVQAFEVKRNLI